MTASNGDINVRTESGSVTLQRPVAYQIVRRQRKTVSAEYMLANNSQIRFHVGSFDKNLPLVIDPVLQYSALLGGSGDDYGRSIAVDASGDAYLAGSSLSVDFPVVHPFQSSASAGGETAFVSKINASGTALLYSTYLGGAGGSGAQSIAIDNGGRAYITGAAGSGFPLKNAYQQNPALGSAYVAVLAPAGNSLIYSTYLGGGSSLGRSIAFDSAQNAYIGGLGSNSGSSMFVAKFNKTELFKYRSALGDANTQFEALTADAAGSVYITGFTWSSVYPVTPRAYQKTCPNAP